MTDDLELLRRCPLFAGLAPQEISALLEDRFEKQTAAKGELVSHYGSQLVIVISGLLEVRSAEGTPLNLLSSGSMFGVANLFTGKIEPPTIIAARRQSELLLLKEETLDDLLVRHAGVMRNYLRFLTDRIWFLNWKIQLFSADTAEQKLLVYLQHQPLQQASDGVQIPPLSQLAELLGMGRASLYRAIESLESAGRLERISSRRWKLLPELPVV